MPNLKGSPVRRLQTISLGILPATVIAFVKYGEKGSFAFFHGVDVCLNP